MSLKAKIAPSILSSDFAILAVESQRMVDAGADYLHVDVMDGHFVPNLTIGAPVVKSLRKHTNSFLDCHLMVSKPEKWIQDFAQAGADMFTFHIEATDNAHKLIDDVKENGMKVGIAIKPKTPADSLFDYGDKVDMLLVMTVEPGFGGQKFMEDCLEKVKILRQKFPNVDIQVDGGVGPENIEKSAVAGANVIVAGTSIFKSESPKDTILHFRTVVDNTHSS